MGQNASDCKTCGRSADPVTDTVKVDGTLLGQSPVTTPKPQFEQEQVAAKQAQEEARAAEEAKAVENERLERERLERVERERLERERFERERLERERLERERLDEEEKQRLAVEADARRQKQEREKAAEEAKAKEATAKMEADEAAAAKAEAQKSVDEFLKRRGFKSLAAPRKAAFCGAAVYPLFLAVEDGDAELVKAMLLCDPKLQEQKNSAGKTALQVAEKRDKGGSHTAVLAALQ